MDDKLSDCVQRTFWEHIDLITMGGFNKETDRVMVCGGPRYELRVQRLF